MEKITNIYSNDLSNLKKKIISKKIFIPKRNSSKKKKIGQKKYFCQKNDVFYQKTRKNDPI